MPKIEQKKTRYKLIVIVNNIIKSITIILAIIKTINIFDILIIELALGLSKSLNNSYYFHK